MTPDVPEPILHQAAQWDELHRWERSELGRALRRLGLAYGEIRRIIPVPKGTLAGWCRDIRLTPNQIEAISDRTGPRSRVGIPVDTQWRRREEIGVIRAAAREFATSHLDDGFFVAGVTLYWGEGSKTRNDLSLANADPRALRTFIAWVRRYHHKEAQFVLKINLHANNDEPAARTFWAQSVASFHPPTTRHTSSRTGRDTERTICLTVFAR